MAIATSPCDDAWVRWSAVLLAFLDLNCSVFLSRFTDSNNPFQPNATINTSIVEEEAAPSHLRPLQPPHNLHRGIVRGRLCPRRHDTHFVHRGFDPELWRSSAGVVDDPAPPPPSRGAPGGFASGSVTFLPAPSSSGPSSSSSSTSSTASSSSRSGLGTAAAAMRSELHC
uniref:Uncharacterized protein n=1 Tax=Panagrellus redivivus TaxID=6233 RepID=A0A7E5A1Z9_PANRE